MPTLPDEKYQAVYQLLCDNATAMSHGRSFPCFQNYRLAVLDTLEALGLWEEYYRWADDAGIPDDAEE